MLLKKQKIYVDTSVFGGVFDDEFEFYSKIFFDNVKSNVFELVISPIVQAEIDFAPQQVKDFFDEIINISDIIEVTQPAIILRNAYLEAKIVSSKYSDDALHVALATVSKCDSIISWNFKHIVHFDKIPLYNAINNFNGYNSISIYSPLEMI